MASSAPSRSSRLLNDSSLPPRCFERRRARAGPLDVERRRLPGILAVAQRLRALERQRRSSPETVSVRCAANHAAIAASYDAVCANTFRASSRRRSRSSSPAFERREHARVVGGIDDHPDRREVLRGRAQHARPADVDLLDHVFGLDVLRARPSRGTDRGSPTTRSIGAMLVLGDRRHVLGQVASREQPAVHGGMQRLHAAVASSRETR